MKNIALTSMSFLAYVSPSAAQTIPPDVTAALSAAPTIDTVYVQPASPYIATSNVIKIKRLTITPNSVFKFPAQPQNSTPIYILAVTKLTVPQPAPTEQNGIVTYELTSPLTMPAACGPQPNGSNGASNHADGFDGGNGASGVNAVARVQPKVYVIVGDISTTAGTPQAPRLMSLNFKGLDGDNGGPGCPGGNGGAGLNRGDFGGPGDAGKAGTGGVGGSAAAGQAGADFYWYITPTVESEVGRLLVTVDGGKPGSPGAGGVCGAIGRAGSGGGTSGGGGGSAKGKECVGPDPAPTGATAPAGITGTVTTAVGNYLPVLPFDPTVRYRPKKPSKPKPGKPSQPPPPPPPE